MQPEVSCHHVHNTPHIPILSHINSVHALPSYFLSSIFILPFHLCLCFPSSILPSSFPAKPCKNFPLSHTYYTPHLFHPLVISPQQYCVRNRVMKLHITQLWTTCCNFPYLRSTDLPQQLILSNFP